MIVHWLQRTRLDLAIITKADWIGDQSNIVYSCSLHAPLPENYGSFSSNEFDGAVLQARPLFYSIYICVPLKRLYIGLKFTVSNTQFNLVIGIIFSVIHITYITL